MNISISNLIEDEGKTELEPDENFSPLRPVYEIIVPTNWKKIAINGEQDWRQGHAFFVYTSYIDNTIDFSPLSYGWSRIDKSQGWSKENLKEDKPTQLEYAINVEESVSIGLGALNGSLNSNSGVSSGDSSDISGSGSSSDSNSTSGASANKNGVNYNMEVYKYLNYGSKYTYDVNAYIYEDIKEKDLKKLIEYCGKDTVNYWNPIHNCAKIVCETWNLISTTHVNANYISEITPGIILFSTPKGLYKNLETINGSAKNYPFTSQFQ